MNTVGVALTAIMLLLLVAFMAPNILAMNRGKVLRNIAIWLAIFLALGAVYKMMHPDPTMLAKQQESQTPQSEEPAKKTPSVDDKNDGNEGFTPPKEE